MLKLSDETLSHFIWRHRYFEMEDRTPKFHYSIVEHFLEATPEDNIRAVRAFRGSAKSTNVCYLALHRTELQDAHFTMIVSATTTLAEGLIADIKNMVAASNLPYTVVRAVTNEIQLRYKNKDYYILGVGSGSALRGIKRGGKRADIILTDDLMTSEIAANRLRIDRLIRWYYSDLRPSLNPSNGVMWTVGTPMTQGDIFALLCKNNPTLDIPLTYEAWPDRFTEAWIDRTYAEYKEAGMLRAYKQEFQLILTDDESRLFDMHKINYIDEGDVPEDLTWHITLDGAFSEKESADYSAFACLGIDKDGKWYVAPYDMKDKPQDVIGKLFELQSKYRTFNIGIEKGQFKLSMEREIELKQQEYQQYFSVNELNVKGSKISRIKALEPIVNSGRLTIIDTGKSAERLVEQLELTDSYACMATNDDALDALAQQVQMDLYHSEGSRDYSREEYLESMEDVGNNDDLWR